MPSRSMTVVIANVTMADKPGSVRPSRDGIYLARGASVSEMRQESGWSLVESVALQANQPNSYLSRQSSQDIGFGRTVMNGGPVGQPTDAARAGPQGWVPSLALMPAGYKKGELDLLSLYLTRRLWELTSKYDPVTYKMGGKNIKAGEIDCSGWINFANKTIHEELDFGSRNVLSPAFLKLFKNGAAWQIKDWNKEVGGLATGDDLDPESMMPGTLIGLHYQEEDNGRFHSIDHIVQVLFEPTSLDPMITQSSATGKGVNAMKLSEWFEFMKNKIGTAELFAVDPYVKARAEIDLLISKYAFRT